MKSSKFEELNSDDDNENKQKNLSIKEEPSDFHILEFKGI